MEITVGRSVVKPWVDTRKLVHWFKCLPKGHYWDRDFENSVSVCRKCKTIVREESYYPYIDSLISRIHLVFGIRPERLMQITCWLLGHEIYDSDEYGIICGRCDKAFDYDDPKLITFGHYIKRVISSRKWDFLRRNTQPGVQDGVPF